MYCLLPGWEEGNSLHHTWVTTTPSHYPLPHLLRCAWRLAAPASASPLAAKATSYTKQLPGMTMRVRRRLDNLLPTKARTAIFNHILPRGATGLARRTHISLISCVGAARSVAFGQWLGTTMYTSKWQQLMCSIPVFSICHNIPFSFCLGRLILSATALKMKRDCLHTPHHEEEEEKPQISYRRRRA